MSLLPKSHQSQVFYFSGTAAGQKFFRGVCLGVSDEEKAVTLQVRCFPRFSFEPGETEPHITLHSPGHITFKKSDYRLRITEGPPPSWLLSGAIA